MLLAIALLRSIVGDMKDPLLSLPGYSLRRAANAMVAELSARLASIDLRHTEASVLISVDANIDLTASALGRIAGRPFFGGPAVHGMDIVGVQDRQLKCL